MFKILLDRIEGIPGTVFGRLGSLLSNHDGGNANDETAPKETRRYKTMVEHPSRYAGFEVNESCERGEIRLRKASLGRRHLGLQFLRHRGSQVRAEKCAAPHCLPGLPLRQVIERKTGERHLREIFTGASNERRRRIQTDSGTTRGDACWGRSGRRGIRPSASDETQYWPSLAAATWCGYAT